MSIQAAGDPARSPYAFHPYSGTSTEALVDALAHPFNTQGMLIAPDDEVLPVDLRPSTAPLTAMFEQLERYLSDHAARGRWEMAERKGRPRRPRRYGNNHGAGGRPRGTGAYSSDEQAQQAIHAAYWAATAKLKGALPTKADVAHQLGCSRSVLYWYLRRFNVPWPPDSSDEA